MSLEAQIFQKQLITKYAFSKCARIVEVNNIIRKSKLLLPSDLFYLNIRVMLIKRPLPNAR